MNARYARCQNCTTIYIVGADAWIETPLSLDDFMNKGGSHSSIRLASAISCEKCKDLLFSPGWRPDMVLQEDYYYGESQ